MGTILGVVVLERRKGTGLELEQLSGLCTPIAANVTLAQSCYPSVLSVLIHKM